MVIGLRAQVPNPTPELNAMIGHARAFVAERQQELAQAIEVNLSAALDSASERDRRRAAAAIDLMLGRRKSFTNQCHGFFYPFLPADEFFDREHFPWLARLEAATADIREELTAILASPDPALEPYIEMPSGTPANLWSELDHSLDWSALHLWRDGERIDAVCAKAPRTAELVESLPLARIPGRAPAVFFSILKAGKTIPPHTGVTNIRSIIHLPLIVPDDCGFRVGGETRPWREGEAFAFDDTIEHEAWNRQRAGSGSADPRLLEPASQRDWKGRTSCGFSRPPQLSAPTSQCAADRLSIIRRKYLAHGEHVTHDGSWQKRSSIMRLRMTFAVVAAFGYAFTSAPLLADQSGSAKDPNERICEKQTVVGSRLATRRVCATRAEWEEKRRLDKEAIDRAQMSPNGPCQTVNTHSGAPSC